MDSIRATVYKTLASDSHNTTYVIQINEPVKVELLYWTINRHELERIKHYNPSYIRSKIAEFVVHHYNKHIEDFPIMDMLENPDQYKKLYSVELIDVM